MGPGVGPAGGPLESRRAPPGLARQATRGCGGDLRHAKGPEPVGYRHVQKLFGHLKARFKGEAYDPAADLVFDAILKNAWKALQRAVDDGIATYVALTFEGKLTMAVDTDSDSDSGH